MLAHLHKQSVERTAAGVQKRAVQPMQRPTTPAVTLGLPLEALQTLQDKIGTLTTSLWFVQQDVGRCSVFYKLSVEVCACF